MTLTLLRLLQFLFCRFVPAAWRYPLARRIAYAICALQPKRRHLLEKNLSPLIGPNEAIRQAPAMLAHFFFNEVDFFCTPKEVEKNSFFDGLEHLEAAWRDRKRVIVITAHLGHWELGTSMIVNQGYPVTALYAAFPPGSAGEWVHRQRDPRVHWQLAVPGASQSLQKALEGGRLVCLLGDLPFGETGEPILMAGHTTRLPLGPWHLALRTQATIVPGFVLRDAPGHYRVKLFTPLKTGTGTLQERTEFYRTQYRDLLEIFLRKYPDQWGVLQPFWE